MARGTPDYNVPEYAFFSIETPIGDVVAERLGFTRSDNRGRIMFIEDWRNGLHRWSADYDNVDTQVQHTFNAGTGLGFHGSVLLDPLANGGYASIYNRIGLSISKKIGIELSFLSAGQNGELFITLSGNYTGVTEKYSSLMLSHQTGAIKISHNGVMTTIVTPANPNYFQGRWVSLKYVIDIETGKYERLMLGNTQYDLSAYSMVNGTLGFQGDTAFSIRVTGMTAVYKNEFHIGFIIISGDEP